MEGGEDILKEVEMSWGREGGVPWRGEERISCREWRCLGGKEGVVPWRGERISCREWRCHREKDGCLRGKEEG